MFREIDQEPADLIRHAQSKCNAWFNENSNLDDVVQPPYQTQNTQALVCRVFIVDGSWTMESPYSGYGWYGEMK